MMTPDACRAPWRSSVYSGYMMPSVVPIVIPMGPTCTTDVMHRQISMGTAQQKAVARLQAQIQTNKRPLVPTCMT